MNSAVMPQIRTLLLFLLTLVPVAASAVTVEGLYTAQVPVSGPSEEAQRAAYADGLRLVLSRVAGNREVLDSDRIGPLLGNAESLLQSYQYQRSPEGTDQMLLSFGPVGVNRALADLQVPVWGANRPLTLGWIAVDSGRDRWVLTADDNQLDERGRWARAFSEAAAERGLPLTFPSADVRQDRDLLSEIRGQFMENLRSKAEGYSGNLVSVVNVSRRGSGWEARWRLEGPSFSETGEVRDAPSSEALANGVVDAWADLLAARFSVEAGQVSDAQRVDLQIENVASLEAYGAVLNSLNGMAPVVSAGPTRVSGNVATMRVTFSGELAVLQEYIALDSRFVAMETESGAVSMSGDRSSTPTQSPEPTSSGTPSTQAAPETESPAPVATENQNETMAPSSNQESGKASLLKYRPIDAGTESADDSEQSFESLYPVLRYRWTGSGSQVSGVE